MKISMGGGGKLGGGVRGRQGGHALDPQLIMHELAMASLLLDIFTHFKTNRKLHL